MRYINNYSELERVFNQTVEISMNRIGDKVSKLLKKYVQQKWYNAYSPRFYKPRSRDVLNSSTYTITPNTSGGKGYVATIFLNEELIRPVISTFPLPPGMPRFHYHMNVHREDVSSSVVKWMDQGNNNSPLYAYEGVNFFRDTKQAMMNQSIHIRQLEIEFRKIGVKVARY